MNGYIAYMDILAFTSKIKFADFETKYKKLITNIENFSPDLKATIYMVSDSIIVTSQAFSSIKAYSRMIYTWGMLDDFWIRGAIAQGEIEAIDTIKIVKENKNIIMPYLGDTYLKAYKLEEKLNMAGIVIDDNLKPDNPDLPLEVEYTDGYMEYQEYLPKEGNENKKRLLLPNTNKEIDITDSLHFKKMIGSHSEDMDKYINTFCFYVKLLIMKSDIRNVTNFLDRLIKELNEYCHYSIIPQKVTILFVAVIDGLFLRNDKPKEDDNNHSLESYIQKILDALKNHSYLTTFTNYLLEYDKKRKTTLYKYVHDILFR